MEGVVNSGIDTTTINLSRTIPLSGDSSKSKPETGARVIVESSKNDQYNLTETVAGTYIAVNLNLPTDRTYRLHIFTSTNREYISDFVENMITPPIDSVYSVPVKTGVQFFVSTTGGSNNTRYYRWSYAESWTYLIDPTENSAWIYQNNQVLQRLYGPGNTCYIFGAPSNSIFIASSYLANGAISMAPLGYVDASTGKLAGVYSLLVKQYALTGAAYTFWYLLRSNSEQLGSIFDAQPSSAVSNIHAVGNANEPVIGYVSVSTVTTKRIFLQGRTLPHFAIYFPAPVECPSKNIYLAPAATASYRFQQTFGTGDSLLISAIHDTTNYKIIIGYTYAPTNCLDCQTTHGTDIPPPYWPPP